MILEDNQDEKITIKISPAWRELPDTKPFQRIIRIRYQINGKDKMRVGLIYADEIIDYLQEILESDIKRLHGIDVYDDFKPYPIERERS